MHRTRPVVYAGLAITAAVVGIVLSESPESSQGTLWRARWSPSPTSVISRPANRMDAAARYNRAQDFARRICGPAGEYHGLGAWPACCLREERLCMERPGCDGTAGAATRTTSTVTVCFATTPLHDELIAYGERTRKAIAAHTSSGAALPGRVRIEYLGAGAASWLSLAATVARHMGLGRGWSGTWIAALVATLTLAATALASALLLREPDE